MLELSKHREKWCWDRKIFIIDKYICIFLQEILDSYNIYIYSHLLLQIYINLNIVHFVQCKVHTMSPVAYAVGVGYILQSFCYTSIRKFSRVWSVYQLFLITMAHRKQTIEFAAIKFVLML
jgi:hypothetical protein